MSRYSKGHSNYILRKKHQNINGGTIMERDWVTIGGIQNFGKGKKPYYNNGNFIFTVNNVPNFQKKLKLWNDVVSLTYDDVEDIVLSKEYKKGYQSQSNDLRDFAYYGSCVELVKTSISNIINEFPACMYSDGKVLEIPPTAENDSYVSLNGYILNNPFNIDLYHKDVVLEKYDNPLRYMSLSFESYEVNNKSIKSYNVTIDTDKDCPQNDQWYIKKQPIINVTLLVDGGMSIKLRGYKVKTDVVFLVDSNNIVIKPKQELIDKYFNTLEGFERQLLNTNSKPLYKNVFITPIEGKLNYKYVKREYIWPSNGYCIDISSSSYFLFVESLLKTAQIFDEIWTDNLYRNMTHESIKNFDWTYTRSFINGEEQDNIDGGERVQKLIHIYGRVFDDIKRNIDGIKLNSNISYTSYNNMLSTKISETLENQGWDVISLKDEKEKINLTKQFIESNKLKWFGNSNIEDITDEMVFSQGLKHLLLSSKHIVQTKGTKNAIEMVFALFGFGEEDFSFSEEYATVTDKMEFSEKSEIINRINTNKNIGRTNDDIFSGIPLNKVLINGTEYIMPYYDMSKTYDGDLYFQSKGGWGKNIKSNGIIYDNKVTNYSETISYLHVVNDIDSLLMTNPNSVNKDDIYYVIDKSNISKYNENITDLTNYTNYFQLINKFNPEKFSSWINVNENDEKVIYLNSIVSTNLANNPHVGYGKYDLGNEFFEYMKKPFKYSIDKFKLEYEDVSDAENITYTINKKLFNFDKRNDEKIKILTKDSEEYYLNSKLFVIENKKMTNNELFNNFFKKKMLPYIMQVIPSTSILILKGFE